MKYWYIASTLLVILNQNHDFEIGKKLPNGAVIVDSTRNHFQLTGPSSSTLVIEVKYKNVNYNVSLDKNKKIDFVISFDQNFRDVNGIKIGMSFKQIKMKSNKMGQFEPGFGYVVPLKSGWNAFFSDNKIIEQRKIDDSARIQSFFKKK